MEIKIGQIWENEYGIRLYVLNVYTSFYELVFDCNGFFRTAIACEDEFKKMKLLGESQVSKEDFFKVKE